MQHGKIFSEKRLFLPRINPLTSPQKNRTNSVRCTIYVQYLYNICTIGKRTNIVQVLYIYCTYDGVGPLKVWLSISYGTRLIFSLFADYQKLNLK